MRLIAIGDIHGCIEPFCKLLDKIKITANDKLVLLGDYIDRGPNPKAVLDKIIELKESGYNIIPILGNHERMMLKVLEEPYSHEQWMLNGGWSTLQSFRSNNIKELAEEYISLVKSFPLYHIHDNYIFVHAGFNESAEDPLSDTQAMLWIRKEEYRPDFLEGKKIIHGHTPIPLGQLEETTKSNPRVINIDTGCVYSHKPGLGYLTALDISNMTIQTIAYR